ncbi:uncharacterized protein LOC121732739 [Aricia agestis]|uniref:uncharacterized protein LOC121732739 n=1 Tax=Aricia agestis TaxID=91739 RepID=UPI001C20B535|nr:uncharacterized protein LOC121732739 [Aricia agestis]
MKLLLIALAVSAVSASQLLPTCDKPVYCDSKLLHHVQMARIFPDSKTFVDMRMKSDEKTILSAFDVLLQRTQERPSREQLKQFVDEYFEKFEELQSWTPEDYQKEPKFLFRIKDIELRQFAKNIHNIWPILGRKVSPQVLAKPESFSMLPVSNGFIIPGVRLGELYYWDTYWIIEGLLVSGMKDTVRGILSNLMDLQRTFGHIPNGNRWYFEQRSQPPLLSAMVMKYLEATHDVEFLKSNIDALESELQYWIDQQSVIFKKDGKEHTLLRYFTPSSGPRPEWYYEDFTQAQKFSSEELQQQFYSNIKSAAESGWDFSSRWFINENGTNIGDILTTRASDIVPVDLNAIFTSSMQNMAYFYSLMHNSRKGAHWAHIAKQWRNSIKEVMWNDEDGIWYDWDLLNDRQRKYFYPSNIAPLWMDVVDEEFKKEHAQSILEYLKKTHSLEFPGGVPTSFSRTGQKWDYPYAWAPLVSMVVKSLEALKTEESQKLAFEVAKKWVRSNLLGYNTYKQLFDKYDVETPGKLCSEDIYTLHAGFGWTIGATLQMLTKYGQTLKAQDSYYNFNTYKPNPTFWHIPTSAYLPAYYKSVKTAPVLTGPLNQIENSNLNSDKTSVVSTVSNEHVSETVKPEEPIIIIQIDPTKPSYEIEKEIILSTIEPEITSTYLPLEQELTTVEPVLEEKNLVEAHKESYIPVSIKPQVIPAIPVKPEIIPSIPVKPEIVPVQPELVPIVPIKPEIVPSIQVEPELIAAKPEFVPVKPEIIQTVPIKPEVVPVRPWLIPNRPVLSPLPAKPEVVPTVSIKPDIVPATPIRPELSPLVPNKPEVSSTVNPAIHVVPLKSQLVPVNPVRPQLVPSVPVQPQVIPSVPVKPTLPLKPEIVEPVPVKPELVPSTQLKPELTPSLPLKPEVVPVATLKPQVIPVVHQETLYPAQISSSYGSNLHISEVAHDVVVPSVPVTTVRPQVIPSIQAELPSASIKPVEYKEEISYNKPAILEEHLIVPDLPQAEQYGASLQGHLASDISASESAILHPESPKVEVVPFTVQSEAEKFGAALQNHLASEISSQLSAFINAESPKVEEVAPTVQSGNVCILFTIWFTFRHGECIVSIYIRARAVAALAPGRAFCVTEFYTISAYVTKKKKMFALRRYFPLYPVLGILGACAQAISLVPTCNSSVYCSGELLHRVQLARIFPDSKTFVDLKMLRSRNETLSDFAKLMHHTDHNPSPEQLRAFVREYFADGNELEPWMPPDFDPDPPFLKEIVDPVLREFARDVVAIWAKLGRRVSADVARHPDRYSFLSVPNGFIIPGGRFKELYYWDSYWIIRGLLICDMRDTARGMIENLLHLVDKIGYVPNGSRVYYLGRSQPPLLAAMVSEYFEVTKDYEWLARAVETVERELTYWLERKRVTVEVNGTEYMLLRYLADAGGGGPRPESYLEDYTNARAIPRPERREEFYLEIRSGAESGWDFSSRWFVTAADEEVGNLTSVHMSRILPVDLNAFFAGALQLAGDYRALLKDRRRAHKWWSLARYWRGAIERVLWDDVDGVWYDYDALARAPRRHFYLSCATPLWARAVDAGAAAERADRLARYLRSSGATDFPGGVPASILHSGEQWDFPNAWPPLQSILVGALEAGGRPARELASEQARIWIQSNYFGYLRWRKLFEKYSAVEPGHQGGGGEYTVQDGFGWTNGVVLELLHKYGREITVSGTARAVPEPVVRIF